MIAKTNGAPYYAVIFSSIKTTADNGYSEMADSMMELAKRQAGFLGVESAREETGITVSYWESLDAIKKMASTSCSSNCTGKRQGELV